METSRESSKAIKQRILDVSFRLFKEHGYDKTTFNMIADGAGISPGLITYHFKNKHNIIYEAFLSYCLQILNDTRENLTEGYNSYLYYCICHLYLLQVMVENEHNRKLLYDNKNRFKFLMSKIKFLVDEMYQIITTDFHKNFTDEEVYMASIMDMGAREWLYDELVKSDSKLTFEKFGYYHLYLIGEFSKLDEATIQYNIKKAYEFVKTHTTPFFYD